MTNLNQEALNAFEELHFGKPLPKGASIVAMSRLLKKPLDAAQNTRIAIQARKALAKGVKFSAFFAELEDGVQQINTLASLQSI